MKDNIVTLATLTFEKAQLVKSILEAEDVECFLENINLIQGAISTGVKINIQEVDFEKAMVLFDAIRESDFEKSHHYEETGEELKILVPIDFSEYSQKAIDVAYDWLATSRGELVLFHAYYSPINAGLPFSDSFVYDINSDEISFELKEESENKLEDIKQKITKKIVSENRSNIKIVTETRRGIAEHEIISFSNQYKPSLIVMGTRGADKKTVDLIGSVTAEIIENAKVPVLAIPENFNYTNIEELKKIGFLSVFGEPDYLALEKLSSMVNTLDVDITCAHITNTKDKETDEVKMKGLVDHINKSDLKDKVQCKLIENEDFWVGVESFVQMDQIQLLSFTTFKRNLISRLLNPSVAKKMLFHSTTPLLVFHA